MGRFIKLPGVNPPSDRPKVDGVHPLLPPNGGGLVLIEPGAPGTLGWGAGVPANGAAVHNIAKDQALALIPGSSESLVSPTLQRGSFTPASTPMGTVERTAKGGLHTIFRPTDESVTSGLAALYSYLVFTTQANSVLSWLELHKNDHSFFFTSWFNDTRVPAGVSSAYDDLLAVHSASAASSNYVIRQNSTNSQGQDLGEKRPANAEGVPTYSSAATNNQNGTNALNSMFAFGVGIFGALNAFAGGGATYGKHRSRAHYLTYVEDLTVSGRTYAQVEAINAAAFAAAFGSGGRYAGDSYTNPNTWTP